jgi:tetratricopeptide (TPR) repeat protein
MLYVLGKFAQRHRIAVAAAVGLVVASLAFGSGMAVLAQRASREAAIARRVTAFTAGLFSEIDPSQAGGSELTARQLLDGGVRRLESQFEQEREDVQAALLEAAASAYRGLGEYGKAEPLLERAVALRTKASANAPLARALGLHSQAALARARGDYIQAESRLRNAVRRLTDLQAADQGPLLDARLELAQVLRLRSQLAEAGQIAGDIVTQCEQSQPVDTIHLAQALATLGRIEADRGQLQDAVVDLERALELQRRLFGDANTRTADAKASLAFTLVTLGQSSRAEPLLQEIVEDTRRVYGPDHPEVGIALSNLGNALSDLDGRREDAERAYLDSVTVLRANAGASRVELANSLNNLAALYLKQKRWTEVVDAQTEALAIRMAALGPDHPDTAGSKLGMALALNKLDRFAEAEVLLRSAIGIFSAQLGRQHWRTANAQVYLGMVLTNLGRYAEAQAVLTEAQASLLAAFGPNHPRTSAARSALADLKARQRTAHSG